MLSNQSTKTLVTKIVITFLMAWLVVGSPTRGADKSKDEETLRNSAAVLRAMLGSDSVPKDLLARADCVIVLPSVKKAAFGVGGSGGRGAMSCRSGKDFNGKWSAPAMYSIGGVSFGLQIGGSSTDFVILVMSQKGAEAVLQNKTKFGNDATVAAGPAGATSSSSIGDTDMLTYGRAQGAFAGMSLGGATLNADNDANQRLYDKAVTPKEIVRDGAVQTTRAGQDLVSLLSGVPANRSASNGTP
jgi:lipid-binding SYLF domain-containing protein